MSETYCSVDEDGAEWHWTVQRHVLEAAEQRIAALEAALARARYLYHDRDDHRWPLDSCPVDRCREFRELLVTRAGADAGEGRDD